MFCAAFEGLLRGDKAQQRSFFVAIEFSFSGLSSQGLIVVQPRPEAEAGQSDRGWTGKIEENVHSIKTKNKLRALITE